VWYSNKIFWEKIMKDKLVPILVVLVIAAAFAVGLLYGKVSVYEKGGGTAKTADGGTAAPSGQAQPPEKTQLTEAEWKEVLSKAQMVKGNKSAKVTIAEFTDYQCPFCSRYFTDSYGQIMKDYVDNGKVQYMMFDLPLPFHPNAKPAALAARCAGDQNKYWEMHEKLFSNQDKWSAETDTKATFTGYAKEIGLNTAKFDTCVSSGQFNQTIDDSLAFATKMGASGTPTFYINGKQLVGAQPYAEFKKALDEALQ
jgi:protein-disulfide isomerase